MCNYSTQLSYAIPCGLTSRKLSPAALQLSARSEQKHSPVSWSVGASIPRLFCGAFTVELRVCRSGWAASPVTRQAPVSAQRCCTADICEYSAQPRDAPSPQSSLATGAPADNLPVGSTHLPLPSRLGTGLRTVFLSYFQSLEPVDSNGYDRRQQHADPAIPCDNHAMSTMRFKYHPVTCANNLDFDLPAKAREYVFTGVGLCVFLSVTTITKKIVDGSFVPNFMGRFLGKKGRRSSCFVTIGIEGCGSNGQKTPYIPAIVYIYILYF